MEEARKPRNSFTNYLNRRRTISFKRTVNYFKDTSCYLPIAYIRYVGRVAQSAQRLATGWTFRGSNPGGRQNFPHLSRPALGPIQPPVQWVPSDSRVQSTPGRDADPSPLLVPWSWKGRAIPLLPLWAVRSVQSLSACTRVHFTVLFTFDT
jgi:hypothetical protein